MEPASSSPHKLSTTAWKSIYLCGAFSLIQNFQFSIFFSSLWPYLKSLDPDFSEYSLGFIIASYSTAQLFSAFFFGYWSNRINQTRIPLITGFSLMALGNLLHFCGQLVPVKVLPFIMVGARMTTGAGSGNTGLLRTHVSVTSTISDRSRAMSYVQGGIAVGTLLGPGFQLLFAPLSEEGIHYGAIRFNIYTAPALFLVFLNLFAAFLVFYLFVDQSGETGKTVKVVRTTSMKNIVLISRRLMSLEIPLFVCMLTSFTHIFTLTIIETIASPFTMMMFNYSKEEAVTRNSIAHMTSGAISAVIYVIFIVLNYSRKLPERLTVIVCLLGMASMFIGTYSYPRSWMEHISVELLVPNCNSTHFSWCADLTPTSPYLFYFFYIFVIGVAFTFLTIVNTTLYSKIIGIRKQGILQGVYQMSGSVGRLTAPLIASNLYTLSGPRSVWIAQLVEIFSVLLLWFFFYRRLIPE